MGFIGRENELKALVGHLNKLAPGTYDAGRAVTIRGRRRVGKTRLAREFVTKSGFPSFQFFATGAETTRELVRFRDALRDSNISPVAEAFGTPDSWSDALAMLAAALPDDSPSIVVLDEVPYLARADSGFEGSLQAAWDTKLLQKPILLLLIGSDLSAMKRMTTYGRPFFQRSVDMEVKPLSVADVAVATGLDPADAIDAYLVTGGMPLLLQEWPAGGSLGEFLAASLGDPSSGLVTTGAAVLSAEFPPEAKSKQVLQAIGSGESTFRKILKSSGLDYAATLSTALDLLEARHIVTKFEPFSTKISKKTPHYQIADPYLRFYSAFIGENIEGISGGFYRPALQRIQRDWTTWRGIAVEPVIRDLLRSQWGKILPEFAAIGSWWNADSSVEVDLVLGDRAPNPKRIVGIGSIKWRTHKPFSDDDAAALRRDGANIPGFNNETPLIAVSRTPIEAAGVITVTAEDLLFADDGAN